ncbi:unnamed protein product [Coregonus sp. 'balchen']|nr:unnamed protein product [Coregonus sp. 'balchen']
MRTLGLVLQNESFNYQCYNNLIMDSWAYTDSLLTYEQCKTPKEQKMVACSRGSSMYKPERTLSGSSPELVSLETPTNIINNPQEALDLNSKLSSLCPPSVPQNPLPLNSSADTYDKQAINNMFDSLLSQKWPTETVFPEATTEQALPYSDPFTKQPSPVYSDSYTNSPPERYRNDFQFILGAPQATQHKSSQLPMVYLNKGQFYPISLQGVDSLSSNKVKTVVMAVFENDKSAEIQLRCWNHWHARQPTVKQRVIDIADYKEVFSGISHVEEVAFNALSFIWNPNEEAKKGVKGLPLNLQIDTYDFSTGTNRLIHRAAVQVKIFCDKGAERKMRDEDRKRSKRRGKTVIDSKTNKAVVSSSMGSDSTFFKTLEDHVTNPVLFIPEMHLSNMQRCGLAPPTTLEEVERTSLKRLYPDRVDQSSGSPPPSKQARLEEQQRVLLYVRRESEEVFDALMLNTPTLKGLRQAISEKYGMQEDTIGKIYKKCKRGIFVNMDDIIIEHYSNHSAFLIEISEVMSSQFQVTLMEL